MKEKTKISIEVVVEANIGQRDQDPEIKNAISIANTVETGTKRGSEEDLIQGAVMIVTGPEVKRKTDKLRMKISISIWSKNKKKHSKNKL